MSLVSPRKEFNVRRWEVSRNQMNQEASISRSGYLSIWISIGIHPASVPFPKMMGASALIDASWKRQSPALHFARVVATRSTLSPTGTRAAGAPTLILSRATGMASRPASSLDTKNRTVRDPRLGQRTLLVPPVHHGCDLLHADTPQEFFLPFHILKEVIARAEKWCVLDILRPSVSSPPPRRASLANAASACSQAKTSLPGRRSRWSTR
ncbi:hypothetical protein BDK51DRAFT_41908 [Blyttiomyces helicus]|uniref:Uncharacterized protein n=1 Tax=Blyttiomyces helicus TaxID=388810 RepID=A0A4P9W2H6_9FUNG|nr:hypothetical protein BDK51DRAFT_41908 [Blyttiomyces helicus]|eukprot:RKO85942.1 hypothetical protein BDK51DRAFT_41908 [Blyttiomyces helicus]